MGTRFWRTAFLTFILFFFLSCFVLSYEVVIVDNTDPGFTCYGWWTTGSGAGQYGTDYRWTYVTTGDYATATAIWRPTLNKSTVYQVYVWYREGSNRARNVCYTVFHNGGSDTFYVNQTASGGRWYILGTFSFSSGTTGYVMVVNKVPVGDGGAVIMADAVKFETYVPPAVTTGGQFRAYWVDTWGPGMLNHAQCTAMVDTARRYNFNAVLPEIRRIGDAYYHSNYEPWASNVSPANFDALSTIIAYAHDTSGGKPYIEVHAWFVMYRSWVTGGSVSDTSRHIFYRHPEWFTCTYDGATAEGTSMFLDPGIPEVAEHLYNVCMDVVHRYDVDGIHFDYIRYPGYNWGYNPIATTRFALEYGYAPPTTSAQYGASTWNIWCQWRRDRVTELVKKIYANAVAVKPNIKVSAATIPWGNIVGNNFAATEPYTNALQDWHSWMKEHILDYNMPMVYKTTTYNNQYRNWSDFAVQSSYGRYAFIGQGAYTNPTSNTIYQMHYSFATSSARGIVTYSYRATNNEGVPNPAFFSTISSIFYSTKTHTPACDWKSRPTTGIIKGHVYADDTSPLPYFNNLGKKRVYKAKVVYGSKTTFTDQTGFYAFLDVPPGQHTITVYKPPDYVWWTQGTTVNVFAGLATTVDVKLENLVPVELSSFEAFPGRLEKKKEKLK